jgi:hypothetical protein
MGSGSVLQDALGKLSYEELRVLQEDLSLTAPMSRRLVSEKVEEMEQSTGACSVCGSPLRDSRDASTLMFGAQSIQRKASFCAFDCLEFFLKKLKTRGEAPSVTAR